MLAAFITAVALWALPSVGSAWMSWSGVDPVIELDNGHVVAIRLDVPTQNGCDLKSISVDVILPEGVAATSVTESSDDLGCGVINSVTSISNSSKKNTSGNIKVDVIAHSDTSHPVRVMASVDGGEFKKIARGKSNEVVSGNVVIPDDEAGLEKDKNKDKDKDKDRGKGKSEGGDD
jgi:hypothetical protein